MKSIPLKSSAFLFLIIFFFACSPSKKMPGAKEEQLALPDLPASELDIPIRVAAMPILAKTESLVPAEFTSDGWPEYMQPSCDFRYKYRFVRTALQISCNNNQIGIRFGGNYQVSGSKCLCTAGLPVTPWISGACGFAPQPLRRVNMALTTSLQFLPNYKIRTTTSISQVQPVDKCSVSVFSSDITQLVMDSIRSSLVTFAGAMDQSISELSFSKFVNQIKDSSYRKIPVGRFGYFLLNPTAFRIGQLNYIKDSFAISLGVSCKPLFSSDPVNHLVMPTQIPPLLQTESRNGLRLYINMNYDYDFLTKLLSDSLHNKVFELKGRTIVVKDASLKGIGNQQVELRIDFAGSNHGSIYLRGTPVLDTAKQTLGLPDIQYSMEGEDLALKIAKSLFKNKIRKTIQGKTFLDIAALLNSNKQTIDRQLTREIIPGVFSSGYLQEAKIIGMLVTSQNIQIQVYISGELKFRAGNL